VLEKKEQFTANSGICQMVSVIQKIGTDGKLKIENSIKDFWIGSKKGEYLFISATGCPFCDGKFFMLATSGRKFVGATISY
jgi:hypothetical protein